MPPSAQRGETPLFGRHWDKAALIAVLTAAAFVRLWRLDLMEFKGDEANACRLALQSLGRGVGGDSGAGFPLTGLMASIGVPNPPLFIYLLALPLAISADPLAAAVFVALANVAAVAICYVVGRRYFSPFVALAASALYALAPWAVIFSRKLWAQDLMPVFICGFLLAAHSFLVDRKPRSLAIAIFLAAAAIQLHFSALILVPVIACLLVAGRATVRGRWIAAGILAAALLYAPYVLHVVRTHGADFANLGARRGEWSASLPAGRRLLLALRYPLAVSGADATDALLGGQPGLAFPFALLTGILAFAGLAWLCVRDRAGPLFSARLILAIWIILPSLGIAVVGVVPYTHYFIVLYPILFLGLAAALEKLSGDWRLVSLAACVAGYAWLDASLFHSVASRGGAPADYGVAYAYKAAAIESAAAENPGRPFVLADGIHPEGAIAPEYRFLADLRDCGRKPASGQPEFGYVLIDTLGTALTPEGEAAAKKFQRRQFGPLAVYVIPLGR